MSLKEICVAKHKIVCLHTVVDIFKCDKQQSAATLDVNSARDDRTLSEAMS
jgi:hypothetical protein